MDRGFVRRRLDAAGGFAKRVGPCRARAERLGAQGRRQQYLCKESLWTGDRHTMKNAAASLWLLIPSGVFAEGDVSTAAGKRPPGRMAPGTNETSGSCR